ncbi:peptidoglycan editing factor PgeF [Aurantiacibacter spongiae]|uniref:Purine nucleoside phosphorylase n=1 Tax=Aurantiacibacter spongiae TaxID=2488860 RepID=A0A3N5CYI0_9SPHN|nr:peptidoglycan editing factor PgeF [Aurantiacibacter spongiae]
MGGAIRSAVLEGVPHAFLPGVGREGEPDPGEIAAGSRLVLVRQVHSARACIVRAPFAGESDRPEADALVTDRPGLALGIVTADCAPVLLADRRAGVVGAAHAGWRGAVGGVLESTIDAMEGLGAERYRIAAAIGPTIRQENYEVDAGFRKDIEDRLDTDPARFFATGRTGHYKFDLPGFVAFRLSEAGVRTADELGVDTYANPGRYHSYRRATHSGNPTSGRQFSLIALPG